MELRCREGTLKVASIAVVICEEWPGLVVMVVIARLEGNA